MKLNNKILYLSTAGLISTLIPANSNAQSFYQCIPVTCKDGQYLKDGKCTSCPAGTYQKGNDRATSCLYCPAGEYSADGKSCTLCPAGSYCPGNSSKITCKAGTISSAGASSCTSCLSGYYSTSGQSSCTLCPVGYKCPGGTDKQACPAGQYQNEIGKSSCKSCSEMRIYYGYSDEYTKKTTSNLKWNTVYTCGNDLFGDPYKGHSKYCAEDTHKKAAKWYMNSGIGIGEGGKFQVVCKPTTGEKCIYDGSGNQKKCVSKDYTW